MGGTLLVEQSKSGDSEAYGRLVEKYQNYIFAICLAYLRKRDLAEDATQEVFLTAFQRIGRLQDAIRFQAWLKRMAINRCLDELRRNRRFLVSSIDEVHEKDLLQSMQLPESCDEDALQQELMLFAGLFLMELLKQCGVDASRFSAVGLGLGLDRLAMIRYGINDIRAIRPGQ